ncbi:hypothetical protein EVAR_35482_1 [Eumeta japonica]|uniref:Uncharacterized protein n=1 Tax=Eumeta variegata TaxID=151549 RepID=A0A4C1XK56_EUMVA|nr:hypothetical protein EVAR_35482_1 [Eumeta japonica]
MISNTAPAQTDTTPQERAPTPVVYGSVSTKSVADMYVSAQLTIGSGALEEGTGIARECLPGLVPDSSIISGGDKLPYLGIGNSKLDCGDQVHHPPCLDSPKGETSTEEVCFDTTNVCGGMDDKIDDVCELMKDRRLYILCVNEAKRSSSGAIKHRSFDTYWFGVDQSQRGCCCVGFILLE